MSTAATTTSKKTRASKKNPAPKPAVLAVTEDDLEPLGPIFADDDDSDPVIAPASPFEADATGEPDDEDDAPAPIARNVGSLLKDEDDGGDDEPKPRTVPAPTASATAPKQGRPTPGQKPHAAALYWEEAKRVGPAHAKATLIRKLAARVQLHLDEVSKWGTDVPAPAVAASGALRAALASLNGAVSDLTAVPVGWAPPARAAATTGPKTLPVGTKVLVKEANRGEYDGVLEPEEMTGLKVLRHDEGKSKVACTTSGGGRVVIPRAHLAVDDSVE